MKTWCADIDTAITKEVGIVSSATEIVMKLVLYIHRAEHSDIEANHYSFLASNFQLQIYEHFNNI